MTQLPNDVVEEPVNPAPKPPMNYSSAARAGLPKLEVIEVKIPNIMDAVPANSFFALSPAISRPPLLPPINAQGKGSHQSIMKVKAMKEYEDVDTDDGEEAEVQMNKVEMKKLKQPVKPWGEPRNWSDPTNIPSPAFKFPSPPLPALASIPPSYISSNYANENNPTNPTTSPYFPNPPRFKESRERNDIMVTSVVPESPIGWITPKVFAMEGGIYSTAIIDFKFKDLPESYPKSGTSYRMKHTKKKSASPDVSETSMITEENLEVQTPKMIGHITITVDEMNDVKPHKDAYFSPSTISWIVFTQIEPPYFGSTLPDDSFHLWRQQSYFIDPTIVGIKKPFPVASPEKLSSQSANLRFTPIIPNLTRLYSNQPGVGVFAFSKEGSIPTIIPQELLKRLLEVRAQPQPGESSSTAAISSLLLLWKVLDDRLFKGETSACNVIGSYFKKRMPWDSISQDLFLGIFGATLNPDSKNKDGETMKMLSFPSLSHTTPEGILTRKRLLRCWLELEFLLRFKLGKLTQSERPSKIQDARTEIDFTAFRNRAISLCGGDDIPRLKLKNNGWSGPAIGQEDYAGLGILADVADKVVIKAFEQQLIFDSYHAPELLDCLDHISSHRGSEELQVYAVTLKSRDGLSSITDIKNSIYALGYKQEVLDYRSCSDEAIASYFNTTLEGETDHGKRNLIKDHLKVLAVALRSDLLRILYDTSMEEAKPLMELSKAYNILDCSPETDEDLLITLYSIRIDDAPGQKVQMREALESIAQSRNSEKLLYYLEKGEIMPAWEATIASSLTRPVGLTNIANTCYLNSLLQYFFTVRELRDAILGFPTDLPALSTTGVSTVRVGGRLVTSVEVERSRRFIILLQTLYRQLIYTPASSVTPTTELAYLALVPSKEEVDLVKPKESSLVIVEDEEEPGQTPTSFTNIDALSITSPTVLGKRTIDHLDEKEFNLDENVKAEVTSPIIDHEGDLMMDSTIIPPVKDLEDSRKNQKRADSILPSPDPSSDEIISETPDISFPLNEDTVMPESTVEGKTEIIPMEMHSSLIALPPIPPPLPPRPLNNLDVLGQEVANYMAFGKQNDVTECMDNVMFQIECALLPSEGTPLATEISLVKRLFYGMMKQTLELEDLTNPEPIRVQAEPFAYLLVDVASEGRNLYDGLDMVFDSSNVSIDGSVAKKRMSLMNLPPILQIQMQRVQYDKKEQKIFKSNAYMSFGDRLYMDRYLEVAEDDEEGIKKRELTNDYRREIEKSRNRLETISQSADIPETLQNLLTFLSKQSADSANKEELDSLNDIFAERSDLETEVIELQKVITESRAAVEKLWENQKSAGFELISTFMHRGTALSGHYFIYQRDSTTPEKWLKYNDSLITDIDPLTEIFAPTTGDTNPYFLVWVSTERLDAIESIKREQE